MSPIPEQSKLRTPSVTDSTGGAISEDQARERGRMVKTADQVAQLAAENGLKVSPAIAESLFPTPTTVDGRDNASPSNLERNTPPLGAVVQDLLPTPNTMEHREIKTPEQIAEMREKSPGGYRNLREVVINELPDGGGV